MCVWEWTWLCVCVCVWLKMKTLCIHSVHNSRCKHVCLSVVSSWMSLVCLHTADNEHINMYIPSQVNACLALQFHGPVSVLCRFHSVNKRLSIRWRKKSTVLNYWTDTWLAGWLMELKGRETEKEQRTKIGVVMSIDARDLWFYVKILTQIWLQGLVEWTQLLKLLFSSLFPSSFKSSKSYSRQSCSVTFITFQTNSRYYLEVELICVLKQVMYKRRLPNWIQTYSLKGKYFWDDLISVASSNISQLLKRQKTFPAKSHCKCQRDKSAPVQGAVCRRCDRAGWWDSVSVCVCCLSRSVLALQYVCLCVFWS